MTTTVLNSTIVQLKSRQRPHRSPPRRKPRASALVRTRLSGGIRVPEGRRLAVQIHVERDVFADAVAWTARALPARPTIPVLAGMRLHADDGGLTLSSFDYDVSAQATVDATTLSEGSALVSGR